MHPFLFKNIEKKLIRLTSSFGEPLHSLRVTFILITSLLYERWPHPSNSYVPQICGYFLSVFSPPLLLLFSCALLLASVYIYLAWHWQNQESPAAYFALLSDQLLFQTHALIFLVLFVLNQQSCSLLYALLKQASYPLSSSLLCQVNLRIDYVFYP